MSQFRFRWIPLIVCLVCWYGCFSVNFSSEHRQWSSGANGSRGSGVLSDRGSLIFAKSWSFIIAAPGFRNGITYVPKTFTSDWSVDCDLRWNAFSHFLMAGNSFDFAARRGYGFRWPGITYAWETSAPAPGYVNQGVAIHWAWIFLLASAYPLAYEIRRYTVRRRRFREQHCVGCGYDLRATPGRCPECGLRRTPVLQTENMP